ncbi:MAG: hypothetical protein ACPL7I_02795 [Myxococcota bacterium]
MRYYILIFVFFILTLGNIFALYPFSLNLKDSSPDNPDDLLLNSYILKWEYQKIFSLDFKNYFNTTYYYPYPDTLSFTEHHTISQLFFIPLYTIIKNEVLTHNIIVFLLLVLAGLSMYIFIFYITNSFLSAILSAILFSFVPYRYTHLVHMNVLHWWVIPLLFLSFYIFSQRLDIRSAIFFGVSLLCQFLWSNNMTAFFIVPFGLYFIFIAYNQKVIFNIRFYIYLTGILLFVLIISLPFILPYLRLRDEMFFERFMHDIRYYSPQLSNFLGVHETNILWGKLLKNYGKWECFLFPGITFLFFFICGLFSVFFNKQYRGYIIFFSLVAVICFTLSLGPYINGLQGNIKGPYYLLWRFIPGYYGIRVPTRFAIFMYFAMSASVAFFIAGIIDRLKESRFLKVLFGSAVIILSVFYILEGSHRIVIRTPSNHPEYDPIYKKLRELPYGVVFEYPAFKAYKDAAQTFASLYYNKPTYNGYSGWNSKPLENLCDAVKNYSAPQFINLLKDLNIRYFVLRSYIPSNIYDKVVNLLEYSQDVKKVFSNVRDVIFEINNRGLSELNFYNLKLSDAEIYLPSCIKPGERVNGGVVLRLNENHFYISKRRRYPTQIEIYDSVKNHIRDVKADIIAYQVYENGYVHLLIKGVFNEKEGDYYLRLKGTDTFKYVKISKSCNTELSESIEISDFNYSEILTVDEPLKIGLNIKNNSENYIIAAVDIDDFTTDGVFRTAVFIEGIDDDNKDVRYEFRYPIYSDLSTGDSIYFERILPVFFKKGRYKLRVDFVSEKRFWFSKKNPKNAIEREFIVKALE